jgi:hypothetical protein
MILNPTEAVREASTPRSSVVKQVSQGFQMALCIIQVKANA